MHLLIFSQLNRTDMTEKKDFPGHLKTKVDHILFSYASRKKEFSTAGLLCLMDGSLDHIGKSCETRSALTTITMR
jgi:hypothetical protein